MSATMAPGKAKIATKGLHFGVLSWKQPDAWYFLKKPKDDCLQSQQQNDPLKASNASFSPWFNREYGYPSRCPRLNNEKVQQVESGKSESTKSWPVFNFLTIVKTILSNQ